MTDAEHLDWLNGLGLHDRLVYDRAFGAAEREGWDFPACQRAGEIAVEKRQAKRMTGQDE